MIYCYNKKCQFHDECNSDIAEMKNKCLRRRRFNKKDEDFPNTIAKAIYEVREKLDMKQSELAKTLGISQVYICKWETDQDGFKRKPTAEQALKLSQLSGFPIERFIINEPLRGSMDDGGADQGSSGKNVDIVGK
jgi:DNA-binding transcriptional regulator YiaG